MSIVVAPFAGSRDEWDSLAEQFGGTAFHLAGWLAAIERAYGHRVERISAQEDGAVVGLLPLVRMRSLTGRVAYVSTPFADTGGIIGASDAACDALFQYAKKRSTEAGIGRVTLRQLHPVGDMNPTADKVTLQLPLPDDATTLWDALRGPVRTRVRKGQKSGVTVERTDDVAAFYAVYREVMHSLGSPPHGQSLFDALMQECGKHTCIYTGACDGETIAGAVAMRFAGTWIVPWVGCLPAHRSTGANNLLYWTMIEAAIEEGCTIFDYGRSTPGEGTYTFKQRWGAHDVPLYWHTWVDGAPTDAHRSVNGSDALADRWRKLPAPLVNTIGPFLRKRLDN